MTTKREILKQEAIKRMKALRLFSPCIAAFKDRNEVQLSEQNGGLYEFSDNEWLNSLIANFENQYNALVYHVIHTYTEFGELFDLLYVDNESLNPTWHDEINDIADGYVFVWCENKSEPMFSEFGTIGVANRFGGLVRNY